MAFQFLVAQDWKHFHLAKNKHINKQYTSIRLFIFHHLLITSNYVLIHLYNSLSLWGWQGIGHSLERLRAHHRANTERKSFEVFVLYHNLVSLNWRHFHLKEMSFLIQKWKAKFPTLRILSSRKDSKMTIVTNINHIVSLCKPQRKAALVTDLGCLFYCQPRSANCSVYTIYPLGKSYI